MKTGFILFCVVALFPIFSRAENFMLIVSSTNQIPASLPADVGVVLRGSVDSNVPAFRASGDGRLNNSEHWFFERGGKDSATFPALFDFVSMSFVPLTGTVAQAIADAGAIRDSVARDQRGAEAAKGWPILSEQPSTNDVPSGGLTYRVAETNGLITFWIARRGDLLATQLSAHDENGNEVARTVDLKTGIQTEINLRALTTATKFSDLAAAKSSKPVKQKGRN